jgi:hypothetical protein
MKCRVFLLIWSEWRFSGFPVQVLLMKLSLLSEPVLSDAKYMVLPVPIS